MRRLCAIIKTSSLFIKLPLYTVYRTKPNKIQAVPLIGSQRTPFFLHENCEILFFCAALNNGNLYNKSLQGLNLLPVFNPHSNILSFIIHDILLRLIKRAVREHSFKLLCTHFHNNTFLKFLYVAMSLIDIFPPLNFLNLF
jgi:hypothetical protein